MSRYALPVNRGVEHTANVGTRDGAALHADADETTRELVHDHQYPVAPQHDGLASKRSTLHRLFLVWPMNDSHDGPVPRGAGR
jgi:hypothetical protein